MSRLRSLTPLMLLACAGGEVPIDSDTDSDEPTVDPFEYAPDELIEVNITMVDGDWAQMRAQDRNLYDVIIGEDCIDEPFVSPYSWFEATVEIDGQVMDRVAVRKKGFIGSLTPVRPSLKLDFDNNVDGREWRGVERLTLNNSHQDPSRIKQCMGYSVFEDAGLPASRCSFAHVTVNGEDLGVYANVEPVKKAMLERNFGDGSGNLYEGTLSDFREGWMGTFDDKTDESDFSDIRALSDALQVPDSELQDALDRVVDVDQFLGFWAAEVAIGHWDGYAGNRNNYYVYADPIDGRFRFIPWGVDGILRGAEPFGEGQPVAVVAKSMLPYRALRHPVLRERYVQTLRGVLDDAWDEDVLRERMDAMQQLTEPYVWPYGGDEGAYDQSIGDVRWFIASRRDAIVSELDRGWDQLPPGIDAQPPCLVERGSLEVEFETTWNSIQRSAPWDSGGSTFGLTFDGADVPIESLGAVVGDTEGGRILMASGRLEDGTGVLLWMRAVRNDLFAQPGRYAADWSEAQAYVLVARGGGHNDYQVSAYLGGTLSLDETSMIDGRVVSGSADLIVWGGQN